LGLDTFQKKPILKDSEFDYFMAHKITGNNLIELLTPKGVEFGCPVMPVWFYSLLSL
jgi:hypothetical protein